MDLSENMNVASAVERNMIDIHDVFGLPCCATELSTLIEGVVTRVSIFTCACLLLVEVLLLLIVVSLYTSG